MKHKLLLKIGLLISFALSIFEMGATPTNIILGIPFYARCAHLPYRNGQIYEGGNISAHDINLFTDSLDWNWDEVAHVPYYSKSEIVGYDENNQPIYKDKIKITFEDEQSVHDKVIFARGKKLKGVFVWHYSADYDDQNLAKAIKDAYKE